MATGAPFLSGADRDKIGMDDHLSPPDPDPRHVEAVRSAVEQFFNRTNYYGRPVRVASITRRQCEEVVARMPSPERERLQHIMRGDA